MLSFLCRKKSPETVKFKVEGPYEAHSLNKAKMSNEELAYWKKRLENARKINTRALLKVLVQLDDRMNEINNSHSK